MRKRTLYEIVIITDDTNDHNHQFIKETCTSSGETRNTTQLRFY